MWRAVSRDLAGLSGTRIASPPRGESGRALSRALPSADAALLIAPESGRILERLTALARRRGALLLGPGPRSVRLAADKKLCGRLLRAAGIPVPRPAALGGHARSEDAHGVED